MSSDAMEQFTEWFNQWVLDHGISNYHGGGFKKGVGNADVDLPMLESAIHDLIAEARALVAADAISQIGHVLSGPGVGSVAWLGLNELRGELAEVAEPPAGEDRIGYRDWADGAAMDEARAYPPGAGSRPVLHVLRDLQRRVARLEASQRPAVPAPDDDSLMGPAL